jgi:hypothetical protein
MKTSKIGIALLGVVAFLFMFAPCVSSQTIPEMLNSQWFQVNGSMKGYYDYWSDNITGKLNEKWKGYIYTTFDSGSSTFTMTACTPNSDDTTYSARTVHAISTGSIHGFANQKQIWDFMYIFNSGGSTLHFESDTRAFVIFPFLVMNVKLDRNNAFKSASFTTEGCLGYDNQNMAVGSCTLKGKTLPMEKVPAGARFVCIPP